MNQKTTIIVLSVLIACGILLSLFVIIGMGSKEDVNSEQGIMKKHEQTSKNDDILPNVQEKTEDSIDDEEKVDTSDVPLEAIYKKPTKDNKEEASVTDAKLYEEKARSYFRKAEYTEGLYVLQEAVSTYSEEGEGVILHVLNQDGTMLANLDHSHGEEDHSGEGSVENIEGVKALLSAIRDPEMALLGILSVDFDTRSQLLLSADSLNPVFEDEVSILNMSVEPVEVAEEMSKRYGDIAVVHRITFAVEGYELYALIMRQQDGLSKVHSIHEVTEGSTSFLTIKEWEEIFGSQNNSQPKPTDEKSKTDVSTEVSNN